MITGHGGNIYALSKTIGCEPSEIVDMSSNVNPLGPMPDLVDFLKQHIETITALPEVDTGSVIHAFANQYNINAEHVIAGNGSTQLIYTLPIALNSRKALIVGPTYSDYADACRMHRVDHDYYIADETSNFYPDVDAISSQLNNIDTVFICNPNNPTGALIAPDILKGLCERYKDIYFIIDESYLPFVKNSDQYSMIHSNIPNIIVLNSMSKIFRIPGLRVGFMVACNDIISKVNHFFQPWSVNTLAQAAVLYLMRAKENVDVFVKQTIDYVNKERDFFYTTFENAENITLFPGETPFILAKLPEHLNADKVCTDLAGEKLLIRNCSNFYGLSDQFIRFSFKTHDINMILAAKLMDTINT